MATCRSNGFTLIELMIGILVFSVVSGVLYYFLQFHIHIYTISEGVAEMNQNIRGAMYMMEREILMAGYSGDGATGASAGIQRAEAEELIFTMVANSDGLNNDGDRETDEVDELTTIHYSLYDADGDGDVDDIGRTVDNGLDPDRPIAPLAENVEAIEFLYTVRDSGGTFVSTVDPDFDQLDDIVFVDVTILARISRRDIKFINKNIYETPSGTLWGPYNDGFRRRYVTKRIYCRNI